MASPVFRGRIDGGKVHLERSDEFAAHVASLEGRSIELVLCRERNRRGNQQNRYYWGVVIKTFGDALGWDNQDLHYELKRRFLAIDPDAALVQTRSTAELASAEFSEYVDRVLQLAAEMGVYIAGPGEMR